ncbi:MAG: TRAP transporter small permease [Spirochaetales bacterium]|jgi:TRAP-type C4-dicarboxylate transport system permease small subunit
MKDLILKTVNVIHILLMEFSKILIVAMVLIVSANVFLRYVFDSGILWSEEVALTLCVWFIFISMGLGVKQRLNITINLLARDKMPGWLNFALDLLLELVVIFVGLIMIIYGSTLVRFTMTSIMPATKWPAGLLYVVVPFAGITIVLEALLHILKWDTYDKAIDDYLSGEGKLKDIFGGSHE